MRKEVSSLDLAGLKFASFHAHQNPLHDVIKHNLLTATIRVVLLRSVLFQIKF
jgi:hypothetical protein